jgi:hypothetical protein
MSLIREPNHQLFRGGSSCTTVGESAVEFLPDSLSCVAGRSALMLRFDKLTCRAVEAASIPDSPLDKLSHQTPDSLRKI